MAVESIKRLLVFAKYPEPGRVKTRLAKRVGNEQAAELYRQMVEEVLERTEPENGEYERIIYYDPPERRRDFLEWLPSKHLREQHGHDLGERMYRALAESLENASRAVVIGSDCVEIDRDLLLEAFAALDQSDLVIGPASDGGYYLIGCRDLYPELFSGISWSTDRVLFETLARADSLKLRITIMPTLSDIDE